jgi:ligand-binding SRPBCC domain-containing protein
VRAISSSYPKPSIDAVVPVFELSALIDAPVEKVFAFHERPDALTLLSPRFPPVRIVRKTGGVEPGARIELRIGPLHWDAVHTAYERNRLFVDEQTRGPFARWIHRHEFEDLGVMTRLTDRVEFQLPGGPAVNAVLGSLVKLWLLGMFRARHATTVRLCAER